MNIDTILNRATVRGIELRGGIEAFAHHLCGALSLRPVQIEWDADATTAGINSGGTMYLPDVGDGATITRATVVRYAGFVLHELLHRKYTNFDFAARDPRPYVAALHNAVEDAFIEASCIRAGLVGNGAGLLGALVDQIVGEALDAVTDWADPRQYPFVLAIYLRDHAARKVPLADGLEPIFSEAHRRLGACASSSDTLDLARWVFDRLQTLDDQQGNQGGQQDNQQGEDQQDGGQQGGQDGQPGGEGGEGAAQDGPSDASDGPQSGDQGEGEGEVAPDQKNAPKARRPKMFDQAREVEPDLKANGTAVGGTFNRQSATIRPGSHARRSGNPHQVAPFNAPARLRAEVRRLFDNSGTTAFDLGRRSGSVNVNALPRVAAGSDRVFKRRDEVEGIDSAVVLVLDVSDSMFYCDPVAGRAIERAIQTCDALVDSLKAAQVEVAVLTFGCHASVLVPWGQPAARIKAAVRTISDGGGTNDWWGVRVAHEMLAVRPEARKVCMVLTDGDGDKHRVLAQCKQGEALGITTIGVGIGQSNSVDRFYTNPIKVRNVSDLATTALSQIKVAA